MTTYDPPTDPELAADEPGTTGKFIRLRDMALAMFEGSAGAPSMNRAAISPGSSGYDGAWVDATGVTGLGFFEPASIAVAVALAQPGVSMVRVDGDVTIAAGATLSVATIAPASQALAGAIGRNLGANGTQAPAGLQDGGGGGSVGAGGHGGAVGSTGGAALDLASARWPWMAMRGVSGGSSTGIDGSLVVQTSNGGGILILLINGNLTIGAGGKITANGDAGVFGNSGLGCSGGGGGGTIIIVCSGTITGGTFEAKGGNGDDGSHSPGGGGGGGGYVVLVASAFSGSQTGTVTGGTTVGGGTRTSGGAGLYQAITLTEHQINSLLLRSD